MKHAPWYAEGENNQKLLQLLTLGDSYDHNIIIPSGDSDSHRPDDPLQPASLMPIILLFCLSYCGPGLSTAEQNC